VYEGGLRVPMIVRWPGRVAAGSVSDVPWAFWDFLPTAAELAGAKPPPGMDGVSVLPVLLGKSGAPKREYFYWESHQKAFHQAVRVEDWKGVRHGLTGALELYDLAADVGEKHNVAAQHPAVVARLTALLDAARTENAEYPPEGRSRK